MTPTPPEWADALLRAFLKRADVDSVSGDLLEEYRDTIHPLRGRAAADRWYVRQVFAFVAPGALLWASLFAGAAIVRNALDLLAPPVDFQFRSTVSTVVGIGLLIAAGFCASMRSGSALAGAFAGITTTAIGAVICAISAGAFLAIWHDPATLAAIRATGGLGEAFLLPVVLILPGAVLGTIGGLVGATVTRLRST